MTPVPPPPEAMPLPGHAPNPVERLAQRLMLTPATMVPAGLNAPTQLHLERTMLSLLMRGMQQIMLSSSLVGPALVAWLTQPLIGPWAAILPALALFAISLERLGLLRRIERARAIHDDQPTRWAWALTWRALLSSCLIACWCAIVVFAHDDGLISTILALITILCAGAAVQFSSWPPVMWATITPMLLGIAAQLIWVGGQEHVVQAVFAVFLWIALSSASLRFARTLHSDTLTRLHNERLLRELSEKTQQAQSANAAKSRFFAAASHDLRQPLQALGLYLSVLQPRPGSGQAPEGMADSSAETLSRMQQCINAMDQLLEALLDLARLDAGQHTPAPRAFALQPFLEHLSSMYEGLARQKQLQLRIHPTAAWTVSDPVLLERALANLLANAIRYTTHGGVLLGVRRRGGRLQLCVMDTGIGIAPAQQASIYEEFVQLHNPGRNASQGYGLGLPTVQRLATLLGHPLRLRSRPGRGSNFMLDLPVAAPETGAPPAPATAPTQPPAHRLRARVLLVEDNPLVRDALEQLMNEWGLETLAVATGEEALELIQTTVLDIVLSDWRLPGAIDGIAVLEHADRALPHLRLALLLTGEDSQVLAQATTAFPVLRKPVRPLRLRTLLEQALTPPHHPSTKPASNDTPPPT